MTKDLLTTLALCSVNVYHNENTFWKSEVHRRMPRWKSLLSSILSLYIATNFKFAKNQQGTQQIIIKTMPNDYLRWKWHFYCFIYFFKKDFQYWLNVFIEDMTHHTVMGILYLIKIS